MNKFGGPAREDSKSEPFILVVLESRDNQLDFNSLHLKSPPGARDFGFTFKQYREVVPRNIKYDPIIKFECVFDDSQFNYAIVLRKSRAVDLYWNMQRVDASSANVEDIGISFDTMYTKMGKGLDAEVRSIPVSLGTKIGFDNSEVDKHVRFPCIYYQNIKNHIKIYKSYSLIRSTLFVAHGKTVSLYSVVGGEWAKHITFESDIKYMFRKTSSEDNPDDFEIGVLLKNNTLHRINSTTPRITTTWELQDAEVKIEGKLLHADLDVEDNKYMFIFTQGNGQGPRATATGDCRLSAFYLEGLYTIDGIKPDDLDPSTRFVSLFSPADNTQILAIRDTTITLYEHVPDEDGDEGAISHQYKKIFRFENLDAIHKEEDEQRFNPIHGVVSRDIESELFLIDKTCFYVVDIKEGNIKKIYEDQNCVGLYFLDNQYCYTLQHKQANKSAGFRLYDILNVIEKESDNSYTMASAQVGI